MLSKKNLMIALRLFLFVALLFILGYIFIHVFAILLPFILGTVFAFIMLPLIHFLEKRLRFPRILATSVTLILFLIISTAFVALIIAQIATEVINLADSLPKYVAAATEYFQELVTEPYFVDYFNRFSDYYYSLPIETQTNIMSIVQGHFPNLVDQAQTFAKNVISDTVRIVGGIPGTLTIFVVSILAAFFIAKDWELYLKWFKKRMPAVSDKSSIVYIQLRKALGGYIKAQAILVSVSGVIVIMGLSILGVEYAFTLGFISAFLDILPYIGIGLLFVPWVTYLFIIGSYKLAIGLLLLYLAIATTRQIIEPKIVASSVGTQPLPTLIAMYVGLKTLGIFGLILGPVILVFLTALYRAGVFEDIWKVVKE